MRHQHNTKAIGQVSFARQVETFEPEMSCFRQPPNVEHVWTRQQVLGDLASFLAVTTLVNKHTGAIPVFHVRHHEVHHDTCLSGVLGERISS